MAVAVLNYEYKTITVYHGIYSGYEVKVSSTDSSATEINIPDEYNGDNGLLPVISIADDGCLALRETAERISIGKNIKLPFLPITL